MRTAGEYRTYRIAATVAPVTVSGGVVRLTAGRFQRATTRITPKKDKVFNRNAAPIPANAITKPASAGPTARAKLNSMPLSADAAGRSSFSTSSGKTARQVGVSNASPADRAKVRMRSSTGDILPAIVIAASATATTTIHISVNRITLRRSTMSPMAPAGRARIKNGRADAVCVRATYIGPALRDTMSQAAPTLCMKVPMSETTSAISRLRNVDDRRGCQRLAGASLFAFAMWVVSPRYQHLFGADSCEWECPRTPDYHRNACYRSGSACGGSSTAEWRAECTHMMESVPHTDSHG